MQCSQSPSPVCVFLLRLFHTEQEQRHLFVFLNSQEHEQSEFLSGFSNFSCLSFYSSSFRSTPFHLDSTHFNCHTSINLVPFFFFLRLFSAFISLFSCTGYFFIMWFLLPNVMPSPYFCGLLCLCLFSYLSLSHPPWVRIICSEMLCYVIFFQISLFFVFFFLLYFIQLAATCSIFSCILFGTTC